jgi:ectoine hydroxylase-related dioxygenase (phytanoyl-CoA dioxygenase family)
MALNFNQQGFELLENLLHPDTISTLLNGISRLKMDAGRGGIRRIETLCPAAKILAESERVLAAARGYLQGEPSLVRAIYFEKSESNNWYVTWHQDKTVAVSARHDLPGWGPWSIKAGAWHVQPPVEVLETLVTLRLHLDPADRDNGCLKVLPGSHRLGIVPVGDIAGIVSRSEPHYCEVPAGGAVAMRPHILHASEKARAARPRRVLHFEYSSYVLPKGIGWAI